MINLGTGTINDFPQGETRIGKMYLGDSLVYQYIPPPPPNYFYSEAIEDGTFTLTIASSVTPTNLEYVSYSTDGGETWVKTDNVSGEAVTITTPTITTGSRVLWKGKAKTFASSFSAGTYSTFTGSAKHNIGGDIGYLFYSDDYSRTFESFQAANALQHFFYNNVNLVNAENLILSTITCSRDRVYQSLFEGCSNLETPPTILATTATGYYCCYSMFGNCAKLKYAPDIHITTSHVNAIQYMFSGCSTITYANLSSIQTSGVLLYRTFYYCTSLSSVAIPPNITATGNDAFYGCTSITNVDFLPSSITTISQNTFYGCTSLKTVKLTQNLTSFEDSSFRYCYSLESLDFCGGTGDITIGRYAFQCTSANRGSLKSFPFERITHIGVSNNENTYMNVFQYQDLDGCDVNMPRLTNVRLYDGVFAYTNIKKITSLGNYLTTIGGTFQECSMLEDVHLPQTVTTIQGYAFRSCTSLITIDGTDNITTIGDYAFSSCSSLEYVELPSVTSMTVNCFQNCTSMRYADIGPDVTTLGTNYAFQNCTSLQYVIIRATTPPTVGNNVFGNTNNCPIYVPYGYGETYKTASGWTSYASRIFELNQDGTIPE